MTSLRTAGNYWLIGQLVDVCQCCCLLKFICLPLFGTLSLLWNLVNKEFEFENNSEALSSLLVCQLGLFKYLQVIQHYNSTSGEKTFFFFFFFKVYSWRKQTFESHTLWLLFQWYLEVNLSIAGPLHWALWEPAAMLSFYSHNPLCCHLIMPVVLLFHTHSHIIIHCLVIWYQLCCHFIIIYPLCCHLIIPVVLSFYNTHLPSAEIAKHHITLGKFSALRTQCLSKGSFLSFDTSPLINMCNHLRNY